MKEEDANARKMKAIVHALLPWYLNSARDLPWRREPDCQNAYCVHVSEIMLQQTQVKTVIPYYERWMQALPDLASLAAADSQKVHKLWEGLGYYSRVRNLQRAAQKIIRDHAGQFPESYEAILELPGIGRYTAGAIASIAFNQPRPILDGNVARVVARVCLLAGDPRVSPHRERFWQIAEELVQTAHHFPEPAAAAHQSARMARRCSDLNQALMELGAIICTPRQPKCGDCPLNSICEARLRGCVESFPVRLARPKITNRYFQAFIVSRGGKYLVRQRAEGAVNALLWEFPNTETASSDADPAESARQLMGPVSGVELIASLQHSITRYRIHLQAYRARGPRLNTPGGRWVSAAELQSLPFSSAHRRLAKIAVPSGSLAESDIPVYVSTQPRSVRRSRWQSGKP